MKANDKYIVFYTLIFLIFMMDLQAQPFFDRSKLIETGVYYYPEHWPQDQWERDLSNIAKLGFEFTHFAEFAWVNIEPEEGKFDFSWLDRAVEIAAKQGLKVIMCTPTPTPPAWMAIKHPEIFLQNDHYLPREHGARGNYSTSSDVYWDYSAKMVSAMAEHFGKDSRIWGWQLDNEPGAPEDYCPAAQYKFRDWLKKRYNTIEDLNVAWGCAFWGVLYHDFSQIKIPNRSFLYGISPHTILDYRRFLADQQAAFLNMQADIIRKVSGNKQWITTNLIATISAVDARRIDHLDFPSYTVYPVGGGKNMDELGFRIGGHYGIMFSSGFYRTIKGVTGVMELQPGQVNWGQINPQPYPGAVRMWLWHAYAGGASFACTYRYRQPRYGSELYHAGIVGTDGVTSSRGGLEYQQFIKEIKELRNLANPNATMPAQWQARRTAILWNHENLWDIDNHKQTTQWNTFDHLFKYIEAAFSCGSPVDIISEENISSEYKLVVAPAYQLTDENLVEKWKKYVQEGGHLILSCRTAQKDRNGQLWEGPWAAPINELIGANIPFYDVLLPDGKASVKMNEKEYSWNIWADILEPMAGTEVWAIYQDQFYKGKPAVISRKYGKGTVTYVGVDSDRGLLEREIIREVFTQQGIAVENFPKGVFVYWRDGVFIAVNYSSEKHILSLPANAMIIFGNKELEPANVLVWSEK